MAQSRIEWTEATWNPVTGCDKVSPGCKHCYAEVMARRLEAMGQPNYRNGFRVTLQPHMLERPLGWRRPQMIFVNSMSDLFHEDVPLSFIESTFSIMSRAHWHTFQVLTKRAERLRELAPALPWPLNLWMGVSVEREDYVCRIEHLRRTPASVRFLSLEPLLGPLDALDLGVALSEMVELIRRYHVMLPPPVAMLLKTLIMLEGTGQLLSPHFSLMEVMGPYHRRMTLRRLSPLRHIKKMRRIGFEVEQLAELLPRRIREILQQVESGKFDVHLDHRGLEPSVNRLVLGMLASALFLGSSLLMSQRVWPLYGASVPGVLGCALSLLLGIRLLRAINKSGHLDRRQ